MCGNYFRLEFRQVLHDYPLATSKSTSSDVCRTLGLCIASFPHFCDTAMLVQLSIWVIQHHVVIVWLWLQCYRELENEVNPLVHNFLEKGLVAMFSSPPRQLLDKYKST